MVYKALRNIPVKAQCEDLAKTHDIAKFKTMTVVGRTARSAAHVNPV
jgi:hypothetical protein